VHTITHLARMRSVRQSSASGVRRGVIRRSQIGAIEHPLPERGHPIRLRTGVLQEIDEEVGVPEDPPLAQAADVLIGMLIRPELSSGTPQRELVLKNSRPRGNAFESQAGGVPSLGAGWAPTKY
jgi:hypothetical protein